MPFLQNLRPRAGVLRLNEKVVAAVHYFAKANKPIAAICQGAPLLHSKRSMLHFE
jgi:putative intracellular protease/amidase